MSKPLQVVIGICVALVTITAVYYVLVYIPGVRASNSYDKAIENYTNNVNDCYDSVNKRLESCSKVDPSPEYVQNCFYGALFVPSVIDFYETCKGFEKPTKPAHYSGEYQ